MFQSRFFIIWYLNQIEIPFCNKWPKFDYSVNFSPYRGGGEEVGLGGGAAVREGETNLILRKI